MASSNKRTLSDGNKSDDNGQQARSYPRKRVSIACEVCRLRKTRCDAAKPACSFCADLGIACTYKKPADASRPDPRAEDVTLALSRLDRIESALEQISRAVVNQEVGRRYTFISNETPFISTPLAFRSEAIEPSPASVSTNAGRAPASGKRRYACKMPNLLTFKHPLPEHSDWSWNCTHAFFNDQMEAITDMRQHVNLPHPDPDLNDLRLGHLQRSFSDHVLRWLPLFDNETATSLLRYAKSTDYKHTSSSLCVVFLIFANGAISADSSLYSRSAHELPGFAYFARALAILDRLPAPSKDLTTLQCRVLVVIYLLFAMRPLEAWHNVTQASRDCMMLIRANMLHGASSEYQDAFRRVYWICYVLENELEACLEVPTSGIRAYEHKVQLPTSHYEEEGMYFILALSSLRKVMVEVLDTVGYKSMDQLVTYNPAVALELRTQIDLWCTHLPAPLRFKLDNNFLFDTRKSYLRTSYYALTAVATWPFVLPITHYMPTSDGRQSSVNGSVLHDSGSSANGFVGELSTPLMQADQDCQADSAHHQAAQTCLEACRRYLTYADEILTSKSLASHLIVRQYYAFTMILILTFQGVSLQNPGTMEERTQLESAIRNLKYWAVVPFMTEPLANMERIARQRGLKVN